MNQPVLYELPHSPYCIPIKRALQALGVPFELIEVPNWDRSLVINASQGAYYQVPLLVHEGKPIIESSAESNDIAHYVDQTFGNGRLFPSSLKGLHEIVISYLDDEVEGATFRACDAFYVDSITDPVGRLMVLRHKERKFGRGCLDQWKRDLEPIRAGAIRHFARFDAMLRQHPFLFRDLPVYADFLLYGILKNYTWNGWNSMPAACTELDAWARRMETFRF